MKTGYWRYRDNGIVYWYECSECCGHTLYDPYGNQVYSAYCPHCGLEMKYEEPRPW